MTRANPFGDLDDFASHHQAKPIPADAIDKLAETTGFPSRKAARETEKGTVALPSPIRAPRRHITGRNRQINIKATEDTITELYRIADELRLPLGAVLEQSLAALAKEIDTK